MSFNITSKDTTWYMRMKLSRVKLGLSQVQAAELIGVSQKSYNRWETGENVPIEIYREKISEVLEVKVEDLFGQDPKRKDEEEKEQ